jgi:hypothetical protein
MPTAGIQRWNGGATQFQNRFRRLANRPMRPLDYDVWVAVARSVEAATRESGDARCHSLFEVS